MIYGAKGQPLIKREEIQLQSTGPGVQRRILTYTDCMMCVENHFEQGAVGTLHSHPNTQITYVVKGKFLFTVGDQSFYVMEGDSLLKEHGVAHGCICLEKGVLLDVFSPMRKEFLDGEYCMETDG